MNCQSLFSKNIEKNILKRRLLNNLPSMLRVEQTGKSLSDYTHAQADLDPRCPLMLRRPLREHTYSNILKILPSKNEHFQIKKNSVIFHISVQNIDCGYSLEPLTRTQNLCF